MSILTFSDVAYKARKKKTRKQVFLEKMDAVLPYAELLGMRPSHPLVPGLQIQGRGRKADRAQISVFALIKYLS